jgi:sugar phosphate isomerase/epimerase
MARPDTVNEAIDNAGIFGLSHICGGYRRDFFKDIDSIKKTAEGINKTIETARSAGMKLVLHNHTWEYEMIDGKLAIDYLIDECPDAQFEIDTYWASNFSTNNPAEQVKRLSSKAPFLHIKDGPLKQGEANLAVGSGSMDIPAVVHASDPDVTKWLIVELDRCDTDMLTAVKDSYTYLTTKGLASGNK